MSQLDLSWNLLLLKKKKTSRRPKWMCFSLSGLCYLFESQIESFFNFPKFVFFWFLDLGLLLLYVNQHLLLLLIRSITTLNVFAKSSKYDKKQSLFNPLWSYKSSFFISHLTLYWKKNRIKKFFFNPRFQLLVINKLV